jgi:uncharacterized membrane protein YozB (DUF420 family)
MSIRLLPHLNACLNALSAAFLCAGYVCIRRGRRRAHAAMMISALVTSTLFLCSYVVYHAHVGSVRFRGEGLLRTAYLCLLASHSVLAVAIVPLILVTVSRALRRRFDRHRRIARITLPLWAYVSVTGVVVYWMLYRL